jgi:hypothetical protein
MKRARLQARQAELMQPFADRAFMHRHVEPPGDFLAQINASLAHHLMGRRIGTLDDQRLQFRHLLLA